MERCKLPQLQGRRFDVETLPHNTLKLVRQADNGPTYLRQSGRVAYVVMTEELFDELWPDSQRVWSLDEMPDRVDRLLQKGIQELLAGRSDDREK